MDIFTPLADSTRRTIIELLAQNGELSATDIAEKFSVSPPAISQHLKVLREARLVLVEKRSRQRIYQINPAGMQSLEQWIGQTIRLWEHRFDRLGRVLGEEKKHNHKKIKYNHGTYQRSDI